MKRDLLDLAYVERHLREGERHLSRQREIVDELECHGCRQSQPARIARDLLDTFEMAQSAHLNDRVHLLLAVASRRFLQPWSAELTPNCFIVRDANGQVLSSSANFRENARQVRALSDFAQ